MKNQPFSFALAALLALTFGSSFAAEDRLKITPESDSVTVNSERGTYEITRHRNPIQLIGGVLQPLIPEKGVHPMGELEVLDALNDPSFMVVDMRTIEWRMKGTIPGSYHIPYTEITQRMEEFGCVEDIGPWDCSKAKKIVAFCNGPACGQSPTAIRAMVREGFPPDKIYYYRGGMQSWTVMGLTVEKDAF